MRNRHNVKVMVYVLIMFPNVMLWLVWWLYFHCMSLIQMYMIFLKSGIMHGFVPKCALLKHVFACSSYLVQFCVLTHSSMFLLQSVGSGKWLLLPILKCLDCYSSKNKVVCSHSSTTRVFLEVSFFSCNRLIRILL